jgi:hypothetical protein
MFASAPDYGYSGRDRDSTRQGGYSAITTQSEVTKIEGVVDHAQLKRMLKNSTNPDRVRNVYRGASPNTLSIKPRQLLFACKNKRKGYASQSGSGERVFGSLNGFDMTEYGNNYDAAQRDLYFAGVSKTDKAMPGSAYSDTSDASGIAYLISGSISVDRNTGPRRISAGDSVMLIMPPKDVANPHTNRAGCDPNHITMQTVPYDPCNHGIRLMGAHACYQRSRREPVAPGIADIPFHSVFAPQSHDIDNAKLTDQQWMALAMRTADDAKAAAYIETLLRAGLLQLGPGRARSAADAAADATTLFKDLGAFAEQATPVLQECRSAVYLNHIANSADRMAHTMEFKQVHADGFRTADGYSYPIDLEEGSSDAAKYARLRWDGPALGVGGVLGAKYSAERWIIGRALADSAPGDTLDMDIGRGRGVA